MDTSLSMEEFYDALLIEFSSNATAYLFALVGYVLLALGMYTIAKRRGIANAWLAWIPFGQSWILGCISDQYHYVTAGREKSKRKLLLWLELGTTALGVVACVMLVSLLWNNVWSIAADQTLTAQILTERLDAARVQILGVLVLSVLMMGLAIALAVMKYVALYDLFRSCDPAKATLYTVLTVLLGALVMGILVLVCRDKDLGMPPRRGQPALQQPIFELPPQSWQPPQYPEEPWEK